MSKDISANYNDQGELPERPTKRSYTKGRGGGRNRGTLFSFSNTGLFPAQYPLHQTLFFFNRHLRRNSLLQPTLFIKHFRSRQGTIRAHILRSMTRALRTSRTFTRQHVTIRATTRCLRNVIRIRTFRMFRPRSTIRLHRHPLTHLNHARIMAYNRDITNISTSTRTQLILRTISRMNRLFRNRTRVKALPHHVFSCNHRTIHLIRHSISQLNSPIRQLFKHGLLRITSKIRIRAIRSRLLTTLRLIRGHHTQLFRPITLEVSRISRMQVIKRCLNQRVTMRITSFTREISLHHHRQHNSPLPLIFNRGHRNHNPCLIHVNKNILRASQDTCIYSSVFRIDVFVLAWSGIGIFMGGFVGLRYGFPSVGASL